MDKKYDDTVLPTTVTDFIKLLNSMYPERCADLEDDTKSIYFKAGQRDVIRFINILKGRADENVLK
jgi:hypothetical protein